MILIIYRNREGYRWAVPDRTRRDRGATYAANGE